MLIPLFFCIFANLIVTSDESYSRLKKTNTANNSRYSSLKI